MAWINMADGVSLKQLSYLLINCSFKKCEVWEEGAYAWRFSGTREIRRARIENELINQLKEIVGYDTAFKLVVLAGEPSLNKSNLALLGVPVYVGTIEELTNKVTLLNRTVTNCYRFGLFRNKIRIIIDDKDKINFKKKEKNYVMNNDACIRDRIKYLTDRLCVATNMYSPLCACEVSQSKTKPEDFTK